MRGHGCTIRGRVKTIASIIRRRHVVARSIWRPISRNTTGDSIMSSGEMPVAERLVRINPRNIIRRRSGISHGSGGGFGGGAMVTY